MEQGKCMNAFSTAELCGNILLWECLVSSKCHPALDFYVISRHITHVIPHSLA